MEKKAATKEQLEQLRKLVDECWAEQTAISAAEATLKLRSDALAKKEKVIQEILEAVGMKVISGTNCDYFLKETDGEAGPQSEEDWAAFKGWMKEKYPAAYETFFKMHMGSLKAFVKKERELAAEKGDEAFAIPGIPAPAPYTYIKAKAKK